MKLDIKDLRIGSYLFSNLTKEIFRLTPEDIVNINQDPSVVDPIPLTEQILVKAGFENITKEWFPDKCYLIEIDGVRYHYWINEKTLYRAEESYLAKIEYLHHLQAILWDLSKIEIELH